MKRILDRYILSEFILPFFGGLGLFSFVLMMDKVLRLTDLVLMRGIGIRLVGQLLIYLIPPLLAFTIPIAILFATLLTFGRLASDNEVIAFWSCGIHPIRIIAPILVFGIFAVFLCLWLNIAIIPSANRAFRSIVITLQQKKAFVALNEEEFQDLGKDMVVYVRKAKVFKEEEGVYEGILIADQRTGDQSRVILARQADLSIEGSGEKLVISLSEGGIHNLAPEDTHIYQMINFGKYKMSLRLPGWNTNTRHKDLSQAAISNLLRSDSADVQDRIGLSLEWHRRFAFPVACLIFALLGSFVGMLSKWSGKGSSFAVSLILILTYYFIMIAGFRLSMAGYLAPWMSVWLPNLVFIGMCIGFSKEAF